MSYDFSDSIKRLKQFSTDLQNDLDTFLSQYEFLFLNDSKSPEYDDLRELFFMFNDAWKDLQQHFEKISTHLDKHTTSDNLSAFGLSGNQLKLKLQVYYLARKELVMALAEDHDVYAEKIQQKTRKRDKVKKAFGWVFANGDTILGSLSSMGVPGADAVSEFKEVGEKLVNRFRKK